MQGPPKFTQIGIFGMKIHKPSGNPGAHIKSETTSAAQIRNSIGPAEP
jgi:hypothetical protein